MFSSNNKVPKDIEKTAALIGKDASLDGTLRFSKSLRICGRFQGIIDATGFLNVAAGAEVKADIKAYAAVISGTVVGNIEVEDRLEMTSGSHVCGDVKAAKLKIADGVFFEGKCSMIRAGQDINVFASNREELKKSLQA
ncbi:MAG: polymer-forming cytoskeletal protein [Spirochaetia bacterium]|nr:polymer-forming cytoskeletal protein [Spirochaetia bacterium]MBR5016791.1 polymer-forming cytoskeletal protein [Spirochaetia bacterium]